MCAGIAAMYLAGEPIERIASAHGVHVTTVSNVARRLGILRTNAESQAIRATRDAFGWSQIGKKGAVQSKKTGVWHPCDSAYEYARMLQLDELQAVASWKRCEHRIPYGYNGKQSLYVPDLEVVMIDGSIRVEEVKPIKFLDRGKNPAKFSAASAYFQRLEIEFVIITEEDIGWREIRNLDGMGLNGVPEEERAQRRRDAALRHLHAMSPEKRAAYNEAARIREAAKRAANREAYNRKAREYRVLRKQRQVAQRDSQDALF